MSARRRSLLARALVAAVVVATAVGCSGIPTSGEPQVIRVIDEPQSAPQPQAPQPGQQADQIVRDFVRASADADADAESAAAARQYLTSAGNTSWQRDTTSVVILRDDFRTDPTDEGEVELRGVQVAELDADRSYHSRANESFELTLHLDQVSGEWRIDDPPQQLVITQSAFQAAYYDRVVYFLNSTGDVLVPDFRYITIGSTPELKANRLVNLVLRGPSSSLAQAATSRLGSTAKLQSNVKLDANGNVLVDLTGVELRTQQDRLGLAAQLAWTLQSEAPGVVITVDGEPLDEAIEVFTTANTASFNPDRRPGTGNFSLDPYYLDARGRIINLTTGTSMWGEWGRSGDTESAAMSAANGTVAAVSAAPGGEVRQLLIGRPLDRSANPESVLKAASITTPSFDRAGNEVWVVQDGATKPYKPQVIRFTTTTPITREKVLAPGLADLGPVTALVLSPDSTRVAVVAGENLYVGVIKTAQAQDGATTLSIDGLNEIDPGLTSVGPVAFLSATQLLVGAKVGTSGTGFRTVQQVSVDGQERRTVTDTNIFGDVSSIAVGSGGNGPVLIAFDDRVWKLEGNLRSGSWVSPDPDAAVIPGVAPFIPN